MLILSDGCSNRPSEASGLSWGSVAAQYCKWEQQGLTDGHFQPALPGQHTHPQHPVQPEVCS